MTTLAHRAYVELYEKEPDRQLLISYQARVKGYNATVRKTHATIEFRLSKQLEACEPEIQIGVMQYLLNRLNKTKRQTSNIDLYHNFLKHMSDLAPVTKTDDVLAASFQRMNVQYFDGLMPQTNLVWGRTSTALLGTYTYATDTIMISRALESRDDLIDYVMHHEMLHKKHKFNHTGSRTHAHTAAFRREENMFIDKEVRERSLKAWLRGYRRATDAAKRSTPTSHGSVTRKRGFLQRMLDW